jgi:Uncharacterized conserved protein (DUF2190)
MGYQRFGPILPFHAGADFSTTGRYRFVKIDPTQQANSVDGLPFVILAAASGEECIGVLTENPKANQVASVQTYDVCKVTAGDTLAVGDEVQSDNAGKAIPAVSTKRVLGRVMSPGVVGDVIAVQLFAAHPVKP